MYKKLAGDLAKVIAFCDLIKISVPHCKLTLVVPFYLFQLNMHLETFRQHLMQSLGDDNSQASHPPPIPEFLFLLVSAKQ